jgi:hypothetical protein
MAVGVAITFGGGAPARASEGHSVVVIAEGADSETVAAEVTAHIEAPFSVGDTVAFRAALQAQGTRSLGAAVANKPRDAQLVANAHAAATDAKADLAILVSIRKGRRGPQTHVWVIDAHATGARVDKELGLGSSVSPVDEGDAVWAASAAAIAAAPWPERPPPRKVVASTPVVSVAASSSLALSPVPAEPVRDSVAPPPVESPNPGQPRANAPFIVQAAMGVGSRRFMYVDRVTPQLRPYDLFAAPMPSISAEIYPLVGWRSPLASGLGITGDYARAIGIASADADGTNVATSWQSFDVGLRQRLDLIHGLLLGLNVGLGGVDFHFDQPPTSSALLPGIHYRFARAGLDARGIVGPLSVFGGGSYLGVTSTGGMGDFFTHEAVGGVEARVGAAYLLSRHFEVSLELDYTRFFFSFNPVPGDPGVAGGALDEMGRLSLALAYLQ